MNIYEQNLNNVVKKELGELYVEYGKINTCSDSNKKKILKLAIEWCCKSQNYSAIQAGRNLVSFFERNWLADNILCISVKTIDINDEWETRRLFEVIEVFTPNIKNDFCNMIEKSQNPEKNEIISDFGL